MARQDAEKDHIKEVIDMIKENFDLEPKITRKLAKTMYDRTFSEIQQAHEDFEILYETIVENANIQTVVDEDEDEDEDEG